VPDDLPLAIEGGLPQDDLHCTLVYLGKTSDVKDVNLLVAALANFSAWQTPIEASLNGVIRFCNEDNNAFCLAVDSTKLFTFRFQLCQTLYDVGIYNEPTHGFIPHVTLSYIPGDSGNPFDTFEPQSVTFPFLYLQLGQDTYKFPLGKGDENPPNYHLSEGTIKCDNCFFSQDGYCNLYSFIYDTGYVCDDYSSPYVPYDTFTPIKAGARHSQSDNSLLRDIYTNANSIKDAAIALGHVVEETGEEEKSIPAETIENSSLFDAYREMADEFPLDENNSLKALREDEDSLVVGNRIVVWHGKDLTGVINSQKNKDGSKGEYFTPETEFESDYTKAMGVLAVDWEHGFDNDPESPKKDDVLGYVDWSTAKIDAKGLWVERVLNRRNKYIKMLEGLIKDGLIGNSSEAVSSGVVKGSNGQIIKWPLKRDTLTVMPMEPRMLNENHLIALKALGIELDKELETQIFKKKQLQIQLELQKEFV
jgi:hypothetical protein